MTRFLIALLALLGLAAQTPGYARVTEARHQTRIVSVEQLAGQPGAALTSAFKASVSWRASERTPASPAAAYIAPWAVVSPVLYGIDRAHE